MRRDDLHEWLHASWTHWAILYGVVVLTVSLVVQVIATVLIGRLV
jgi:hypothetical protein